MVVKSRLVRVCLLATRPSAHNRFVKVIRRGGRRCSAEFVDGFPRTTFTGRFLSSTQTALKLMTTDDPLLLDPATAHGELRELLARQDAHITDLTARVSHTRHELNNLLTGVLGQAQLVLMREELTPTARRRLETLEELAKRMRDAVAGLNDI